MTMPNYLLFQWKRKNKSNFIIKVNETLKGLLTISLSITSAVNGLNQEYVKFIECDRLGEGISNKSLFW